KSFYTEPSNASRTQLLNLNSCDWDSELCKFFGIKQSSLPKVLDSNSTFGMTDLFGELSNQIPINSVLGDSQAALRAENCVNAGECKVTFGTGSSVVLNTGQQKIQVKGLNTSIAWRTNNITTYILEGNINYSGAIITWLKDKLQVIDDPSETSRMAKKAINTDT
ncbi:FGGY family carbohydrate kinase, partial [Lactiplantibacillus plantarum]|uniref:FGGY family carbohydrate kinase n=1 Tax=Lactiplantibacillus plantarum TaxID=1590 RepID=UPI002DE7EDC9